MNRAEIIATVEMVGNQFTKVMASLCSREYVAGYKRAISDMIKVFGEATIDENFDAERAALHAQIKCLKMQNAMLSRDNAKYYATIERLLEHVDIHKVLGM